MRKIYIMLALLAFTAVSCNKNNEKSDAYGNFEATEVIIASQGNGKILMLDITEGKVLKSGETYGFVDTTDLYLKKEQLLAQKEAVSTKTNNIIAQIDVLKQQRKNLEVDKARIMKMNKDGAATQKQVDDVNGGIDVVNKQIASVQTQNSSVFKEINGLEKQIEQLESSIQKCYFTNTNNGTVLVKYAEQGEITSFGKPLFKIADLSTMILKVYVSGDQLPKIKIGSKCEVMVDLNETENKKHEGVISWIADNAEFTPKIIQTKKERVNLVYAVKVLVKNDGSLKIGMPGEVNF
jgi:HlyD family secretion protein